jgi:hypothetical protein
MKVCIRLLLCNHAAGCNLPLIDYLISGNEKHLILQIDAGAYVVRNDSEPVSYADRRIIRNHKMTVLLRKALQDNVGMILNISKILSLS